MYLSKSLDLDQERNQRFRRTGSLTDKKSRDNICRVTESGSCCIDLALRSPSHQIKCPDLKKVRHQLTTS